MLTGDVFDNTDVHAAFQRASGQNDPRLLAKLPQKLHSNAQFCKVELKWSANGPHQVANVQLATCFDRFFEIDY